MRTTGAALPAVGLAGCSGEHGYYCVPREQLGMVDTVVVGD